VELSSPPGALEAGREAAARPEGSAFHRWYVTQAKGRRPVGQPVGAGVSASPRPGSLGVVVTRTRAQRTGGSR
jgi:hypothetical protein